jgi:hypothetical protein
MNRDVQSFINSCIDKYKTKKIYVSPVIFTSMLDGVLDKMGFQVIIYHHPLGAIEFAPNRRLTGTMHFPHDNTVYTWLFNVK